MPDSQELTLRTLILGITQTQRLHEALERLALIMDGDEHLESVTSGWVGSDVFLFATDKRVVFQWGDSHNRIDYHDIERAHYDPAKGDLLLEAADNTVRLEGVVKTEGAAFADCVTQILPEAARDRQANISREGDAGSEVEANPHFATGMTLQERIIKERNAPTSNPAGSDPWQDARPPAAPPLQPKMSAGAWLVLLILVGLLVAGGLSSESGSSGSSSSSRPGSYSWCDARGLSASACDSLNHTARVFETTPEEVWRVTKAATDYVNRN